MPASHKPLRILPCVLLAFSIWPIVALGQGADDSAKQTLPSSISCEGTYQHHLQGFAVDAQSIYWSFTTQLVKTDRSGKVTDQVTVANHHGDICLHDGRLYVAVNLGEFNNPAGKADSWVYVYDARDLRPLAKHAVPQVFHGAGGIGYRDHHFYVVGGLPDGVEENYVYQYTANFEFVRKHTIPSGHTHLGIQTATFAHDRWWFGCYGSPQILLVTDTDFKMIARRQFDCSLGVEAGADGELFVASGNCRQGCTGEIRSVPAAALLAEGKHGQ